MSGADGTGLLVLTALPEERAAVARALAGTGVDARVLATGDGGVRAARGAREAIATLRPAAVVGAGVAGALSASLSPGDLVASERVLDAAEEAPPPDRGLLERALAVPGVRPGTLLSVVSPALSAAQKAALRVRAEAATYGAAGTAEAATNGAAGTAEAATYGAAGTAEAATNGAAGTAGRPAGTASIAAVDMESSAWARACAAAGVPYVILRAISDTADEDLPGYLAHCMDAQGSIRRTAVARNAVLHPGSIPALLRMRRRVADCGRVLGDAVAALAASLSRV